MLDDEEIVNRLISHAEWARNGASVELTEQAARSIQRLTARVAELEAALATMTDGIVLQAPQERLRQDAARQASRPESSGSDHAESVPGPSRDAGGNLPERLRRHAAGIRTGECGTCDRLLRDAADALAALDCGPDGCDALYDARQQIMRLVDRAQNAEAHRDIVVARVAELEAALERVDGLAVAIRREGIADV